MINVEVRNFQSIEHAEICIDGFTALVGKSNIGKSAIVRAVRAALTGATGTSFVRHGPECARRVRKAKTCECYCSVHLKTDGFVLKWEKGDKRNRYECNGTEYGVPNRGTPEFLERPALAEDFGMVKVGEKWQLLQVADQFDNVFLLDETGSVVADVFSDVARLDRINVAMRLVEKDRKEAVSTRKVREKDVLESVRQLEVYETLDRDLRGVDQVESAYTDLLDRDQRFKTLNGYLDELRDLGYQVDLLQKACAVEAPDVKPVLTKVTGFATANRLVTSLTERAGAVKGLMGVENVPEPVLDPLLQASKRHMQVASWAAKLAVHQEYFSRYKGLAEVPEFTGKSTGMTTDHDRLKVLQALASKFDACQKAVEKLELAYEGAVAEEAVVKEEMAEFGHHCPTCAQPVWGEHDHAKRHVA